MQAACILIHSPLVGPLSWSLVADVLRQHGIDALTPALEDGNDAHTPLWSHHALTVARQVNNLPRDRPVMLIGHSGAGPLLPAIGEAMTQPVTAYVFVDAGIPVNGKSRLALMDSEDPAFATELRAHLEVGGRFPEWRDEDLVEVLPDASLRRGMLAELRPRALAFFEESIPVFPAWPNAPCGFLQLSAAYDVPAAQAREFGWYFRQIDAGHFHMLVDPQTVAHSLMDVAGETQRE